jgi:G6PDH family F420-dependent oxidoreductase
MLVEAVEIIRELFAGGYVSRHGGHFEVDSAKLWDLPDQAPPIGIAVSGRQSAAIAGQLADLVIAVEPKRELLSYFAESGGSGKPSYGQLPVSFDPDPGEARRRAHRQFRWFSGGWKVNAELPGTAAFAAASRSVTEEDVASQIPCGPDVERHLEGIRRFAEAGFSHLALVQVGGDQQPDFVKWAGEKLLPTARQL